MNYTEPDKNDIENEISNTCENEAISNGEYREVNAPSFTPIVKCDVVVSELNDEQLLKESKTRYYRTQLVLALLGIMLSFMYGIGIVFSIISLIRSASLRSKENSTTIRWAFYLSIVGIILNALTAVVYYTFLIFGPSSPEELVPEALISSIIDL